ncbi:pyrimidine utilization protein C [Pseudonocardia eucalypti]|uniref:Pyrimidine utilization protein C n=1 Tax=Pseudonocardia eucalypti TaxID=648755 RepID=A0ABP9QIL8_9PSEU|nr:reactive intermediate/imine deaminase [Pseudonocardia eucalypti]
MAKREVAVPGLSRPVGHFAQAITVAASDRLVFVSGMTARGPDGAVVGAGDAAAQTRQACENLKTILEASGSGMDQVVRVDVYLRNIEHFDDVHRVRREFFPAPPPASTMVEVAKLVDPEMLVEITAVAVAPERER